MTLSSEAIKNFSRTNGLGTITFSSELISSIIKKVLTAYPYYSYKCHRISEVRDEYYEVSISIKALSHELNMKEIDRMQKELLIVLKQSLSLNCVLFLNVSHGK